MNTMESAAVVGSMLGIVFARQQLSNLARFVGGGKATREPETPHRLECDYLVVGAGAASLAFVDTLLTELPRAEVVLVDRHDAPGGHWNDAYDFVRLHQPSIVYGLASRKLEGSWLWNFLQCRAPWRHRANKSEILAHFASGVRDWVKSGRVRYYPRCEYDFSQPEAVHSEGGTLRRFRSCDGSTEYTALVRHKVVNGTEHEPLIPSRCPLPFPVDKGVEVITPNDLAASKKRRDAYVVLGCGKTGMDVVVYLQRKMRVDPKRIHLVVPSDVWIWNRFPPEIWRRGGPWDYVHRYLELDGDFDKTLLSLEAEGLFFRLDPGRMPTVLRHPIIEQGELDLLKRTNHIRRGRVSSIVRAANGKDVLVKFGPNFLPLTFAENTAFVHCCSPGPFNGHLAAFTGGSVDVFDSPTSVSLYIIFTPPASLPSCAIAYLEAAARRGTLDLEFGRNLVEDADLEPWQVLQRLFHPWPAMNRGCKEQVAPILNLALFFAVADRDCLEVLRWFRGNKLSLFSTLYYRSNMWNALNAMAGKRDVLRLTAWEERVVRKLIVKLEPIKEF